MIKKIFLFVLGGCLLLAPILVFAEVDPDDISGPPRTLAELKEMISRGLQAFPAAFKKAVDQGIAFWQRLYQKIKDWWGDNYAARFNQWFSGWRQKIKDFLAQRGVIFKEELKKEETEMKESIKEDVPEIKKTFWEKFQEIIQ